MATITNTDIYKETPGFVPISDWPTLVDLCANFDENLLPDSSKLSSKTLDLVFEDGYQISHHFEDSKTLTWKILQGPDHIGLSDSSTYRAFEVRPNIFLVDFYKEAYEEHVTIIIDLASGQAVIAISSFYTSETNTRRTRTTFTNAHLQSFQSVPFPPTEEMVGKHIMYKYTGSDVYEHIYFNSGTFTWHCLSGTEKGLADTEPCKMLRLGEKLYVLFWTEKIMPVESVVVVDLEAMRSTGRFFCWDPKEEKLVHTLFGSRATMLGDTAGLRPVV